MDDIRPLFIVGGRALDATDQDWSCHQEELVHIAVETVMELRRLSIDVRFRADPAAVSRQISLLDGLLRLRDVAEPATLARIADQIGRNGYFIRSWRYKH